MLTTEPLRTQHRDRVEVRKFELAVEDGPDRGLTHVSVRERIVVGTHEGVDVRLTDRAVSRFHCELVLDSDAVVLTDLGSRNGTAIDTVPIKAAPLRDGASIMVGASRLRFRLVDEHAQIPLAMTDRFGRMVGSAPATRAVMAQLARVAPTDTTVLLEGETGTGKEIAAESIHAESTRRDGPFLVVDCGAVPADLLEDELFGHVRGAFTGADDDKLGIFEAAAGGTVLLDEIGELALALQPRLLRAIESREIKRIGESTYRAIDVRIIAATNRDLRGEVNAQRFRPDLYYRLAVVQIRLPALRERVQDLPQLVDVILESLGESNGPVAATLRTQDARDALAAHAWPGNVRELRNYVERAVVLRAPPSPGGSVPSHDPLPADATFKDARDRATRIFEHAYLTDLLAKHDDNVAAAARAAGLDRIYLYRLLWRHGLRQKT